METGLVIVALLIFTRLKLCDAMKLTLKDLADKMKFLCFRSQSLFPFAKETFVKQEKFDILIAARRSAVTKAANSQ